MPEIFTELGPGSGTATARDSGPPVGWLQGALNQVLGSRLAVDGMLGTQTRAAIRGFQQRRGLAVDGRLTPQLERALVVAGATPRSAPGSPARAAGPMGAPRLIRREDTAVGLSVYVEIPLGSESPARPMTGIYVPPGFSPQPRVDLIVYLHGFKSSHPAATIDAYWDSRQFPYWPLRDGVAESRKNVILVAPTLGPRSQAGRLLGVGGFDAYLDQIMKALTAHGPYADRGPAPTPGNIVLACHSGGGRPMRQLAVSEQRSAAQVRECWGFDCLYNADDAALWIRWARSRPDARLFLYYLSSAAELSKRLQAQRLPNILVERSIARGHNWVPVTHWRNRIQTAPFFGTRGQP
jgi:Putative peptidoglycan binding domain